MAEKNPGLMGEIKARSLMNRLALAMCNGDDFADPSERLEWQALIALDEIAHADSG